MADCVFQISDLDAVSIRANSWGTRSLTVAACWGQLTVWGVIRIWMLLVGSAQATWLTTDPFGFAQDRFSQIFADSHRFH
jgi:hypothetical protein